MVEDSYLIKAPISLVWQALTDVDFIKEWTGAPASFDAKVGGKFGLWGGDIYGINTVVNEPNLLEQDWSYDGWPKPSKVKIELVNQDDVETLVHLTHTDMPEDQIEQFAKGWTDEYFGPLIKLVEAQK